jgi:prepilin-type N-terminal cleavage/methylation domain-containing protein
MSKNNTNRGFTLIEILVVISVIVTLATIIMAFMGGIKAKAYDAKKIEETDAANTAIKIFQLNDNRTPGNYQGENNTFLPNGRGTIPAVEGSNAFNKSMNELVEAKLLPAIPQSPDGKSYSYFNYGGINGEGAKFMAILNSGETYTTNSLTSSSTSSSTYLAPILNISDSDTVVVPTSVTAGSKDVPLLGIKFTTQNGNVTIVGLSIISNDSNTQSQVDNLRIYDGDTLIASAGIPQVINNTVSYFFTFSSTIPADSSKTYTIKGDILSDASGTPQFHLGIVNVLEGTSDADKVTINSSPITGNKITINPIASLPTPTLNVVLDNTIIPPSSVAPSTNNVVMIALKYTAQNGDFVINGFQIGTNDTLIGYKVTDLKLYEGNTLVANAGTSFNPVFVNGTLQVEYPFNYVTTIHSGESRIFVLKGDITTNASGSFWFGGDGVNTTNGYYYTGVVGGYPITVSGNLPPPPPPSTSSVYVTVNDSIVPPAIVTAGTNNVTLLGLDLTAQNGDVTITAPNAYGQAGFFAIILRDGSFNNPNKAVNLKLYDGNTLVASSNSPELETLYLESDPLHSYFVPVLYTFTFNNTVTIYSGQTKTYTIKGDIPTNVYGSIYFIPTCAIHGSVNINCIFGNKKSNSITINP